MFQAIETIADSKINKLKFDKTIKAIITSDAKADIGEYEVKYQDLIFSAYASNNTVRFKVDENVLVLVPEGDMSNRKTIIASNKQEGEDFVDFDQVIDKLGINFVNEADDFEIGLSTTFDETVSFNVKKELMISQYPGQRFLLIGADLYTNINPADLDGEYGIAVDCVFLNEKGERIPHTFEFTNLNVTGNPYQARGYKETIIPLLEERLIEVVGARAYSQGFTAGNEKIIFKKLIIEYVDIRDQDKSDYSGNIIAPKGTDFKSALLSPDEKLPLIMEFKQKGNIITTDAINYKWFVLNGEITSKDDPSYHPDAGFGWEWLKIDDYPEDMIKGVNTRTLEVTASFVPTFSYFKCIASYTDKGVMVEDTVTLTDHTESIFVTIESSNGISFVNGRGSTVLTCKVTQNSFPLDMELDYEWTRIKADGEPEPIDKGIGLTEITVSASNIGLKSTYICEVSIAEEARPIATGSIDLVNITDGRTQGVVVVGGFRTVLYDADGNAPENLVKSGFQFDVYDSGEKVTEGIQNVWRIPPVDKTLLVLEGASVDADGYQTTTNKILNLDIADKFDILKNDNTIILDVIYTVNGIASVLNESVPVSITKIGQNGADGAAGSVGPSGETYVYEIQGGSPTLIYDGAGVNPRPNPLAEMFLMFSVDGNDQLAKDIQTVTWNLEEHDTSLLSFQGTTNRSITTDNLEGGTTNPHRVTLVPDANWSPNKFNNFVSIVFEYNNKTFREYFPIAVSKDGVVGENGYSVSTTPSSFGFKVDDKGIIQGNRNLGIRFYVTGENFETTPFVIENYTTPPGVLITRNDVGDGVVFSIQEDRLVPTEGFVEFTLKVNSKRIFPTFSFNKVLDGTSPYSITLISSNGLTFKRGDIETDISAFVIKGTEIINPMTLQDSFIWIKKDKEGNVEEGWTPIYVDGQKHVIKVSPEDIIERATFECKIDLQEL